MGPGGTTYTLSDLKVLYPYSFNTGYLSLVGVLKVALQNHNSLRQKETKTLLILNKEGKTGARLNYPELSHFIKCFF